MQSTARRLSAWAAILGLILLVPLTAMVTDVVSWDVADFAVAGALLMATGLGYELVVRKLGNIKYRVAAGVVLAALLLLVWADLAVGVFGTPLAGQ